MRADALKVLHVYRTYFPDPPGGLQEAIRQICLAVKPFGIDNIIFTLSPNPEPSELQREEARVVRCRSWAAPASCDLGGVSAFTCFRQLAREVDVIHYLFPWPFGDVLHQAARPRKPAVVTYVSDIVRQRWLGAAYAPLMWKAFLGMRAIVANSSIYARTSPVLSHASVRDRLRVIPLGIDERSYPKTGDDRVILRLGMRLEDPFFLFVGVLRYYKGLHHLIRAAAKVGARIVIAGSGPEEGALRQRVVKSAVQNVIFAGQVSEKEKVSLLRHCRALVLPSHLRAEAYGMVLVEAAMFGKPMISCEIGTGTSLVNAHQETGFIVPPGDPAALANAMNRLLVDESTYQQMGFAARLRYERLFSADALGRGYAQLFQDVA
jgi:rhamnosyl/mannosyltransferase